MTQTNKMSTQLGVEATSNRPNRSSSATSQNEGSTETDWDLVVGPQRSLLDLNLTELWDYRDLLWMFVRRDIVTVYKQTVLGPIWFVAQPILTTFVYLFVFGRIAQLSTDGLPGILFYLAGITMWNYFADSFNNTSVTFRSNAHIFGKVYFPRLIVPLSIVLSGLIKFSIQFALFVSVWGYYLLTSDQVHPSYWLLSMPYLILLMAGLGLGFGVLFSAMTTKYRDLTFVIQFGVQLAMFATPIVYPMSVLSDDTRRILWWNPISHLVEAFKRGFLGVGEASFSGLVYATVFTIAVLIIGVIAFNRTEQNFMDTV